MRNLYEMGLGWEEKGKVRTSLKLSLNFNLFLWLILQDFSLCSVAHYMLSTCVAHYISKQQQKNKDST